MANYPIYNIFFNWYDLVNIIGEINKEMAKAEKIIKLELKEEEAKAFMSFYGNTHKHFRQTKMNVSEKTDKYLNNIYDELSKIIDIEETLE